jgi:hypothetical protein
MTWCPELGYQQSRSCGYCKKSTGSMFMLCFNVSLLCHPLTLMA